MNDFTGLYNVREYQENDKAFILATFLRGLYYGNSWFGAIPKKIFMDNYKVIAQKLIENPNVRILVACLPDDPNVILGYSVLSKDLKGVHWVFVKQVWRQKGISKTLVPQNVDYCTHLSQLGSIILKEKFKSTEFNPFKIS